MLAALVIYVADFDLSNWLISLVLALILAVISVVVGYTHSLPATVLLFGTAFQSGLSTALWVSALASVTASIFGIRGGSFFSLQ